MVTQGTHRIKTKPPSQSRRSGVTLPNCDPSFNSHKSPAFSHSFMTNLIISARFSKSQGGTRSPDCFLQLAVLSLGRPPLLQPYQRIVPSELIHFLTSHLLAKATYFSCGISCTWVSNITSGQLTTTFSGCFSFIRQKISRKAPKGSLGKRMQ